MVSRNDSLAEDLSVAELDDEPPTRPSLTPAWNEAPTDPQISVVVVASQDGEAARVVEESGCYPKYDPQRDPTSIAGVLEPLPEPREPSAFEVVARASACASEIAPTREPATRLFDGRADAPSDGEWDVFADIEETQVVASYDDEPPPTLRSSELTPILTRRSLPPPSVEVVEPPPRPQLVGCWKDDGSGRIEAIRGNADVAPEASCASTAATVERP